MTSDSPMIPQPIQTPKLELYSLKELEEMALHITLTKMGVKNPRAFLDANEVHHTSVFKVSVGMSIAILSVTPKPSTDTPVQG